MAGRHPLPVGTHGTIRIVPGAKVGYVAKTYFRDTDGESRLVERAGRTRDIARNNLLTALQQRPGANGKDGLTAESLFGKAADLWLTSIEAAVDADELSPNTLQLYRLQLANHVRPAFARLRLREVTTPRVDSALHAIRRTAGVPTAKTCRTVMSGVLGLAARHGAVAVNPVREAGRLRRRPQRTPRSLTADERARWLAQLEADVRAVAKDLPDLTRWMLATGVRIGEALAVSWDEVDLEVPKVLIAWNLIRVTGQGLLRVSYVKSPAGIRELPLPPFAVVMLRRRAAELGDTGPLFPNVLGGWRDPSNTSRDLRDARGTAGFRWVTSHVFRKTCATILDDAGLSARTVADQLGHSRPSLTQDAYMGRKIVNPATAAALERALNEPCAG
jgi:integrase